MRPQVEAPANSSLVRLRSRVDEGRVRHGGERREAQQQAGGNSEQDGSKLPPGLHAATTQALATSKRSKRLVLARLADSAHGGHLRGRIVF